MIILSHTDRTDEHRFSIRTIGYHKDSQEADKPVLPAFDKILTLGRINKLLLLSLNRIFRKQSMLCDIVCSKSMEESLLSDRELRQRM